MKTRDILWLFLLACSLGAAPAATETWEQLADGSSGREADFVGAGGLPIPAYIRKPAGNGPFPVVVLLHGGAYSKDTTMAMGRMTKPPVADFVKQRWAVYAIDFRPSDKKLLDSEREDTIEAVKAVRKMPFIDPKHVGMMGGSHGANVTSRMVSRVDLSGAVLCAPAAIDLIEVKKAVGRNEDVVGVLKKIIDDKEKELGVKLEEVEKDPAKYGYSSAFTEIKETRCPILIVNGRNDNNSPTSVIDEYVKRLRAADKKVETYLPDNGPHGFYFGHPDLPETKEAAQKAVEFFKKCFAADAAAAPAE